MKRSYFHLAAKALATAAVLAATPLYAADSLKIGFLTDLSGAGSALNGKGSIPAIEMAIEEAGGEVLGMPIELVVADTQNKPDVGLSVAREWIDNDGVDVILDVNNSAVALAIVDLVNERKKTFLTGGSSTKFTNDACSPYVTQWIADTYALSRSMALPNVEAGNDKWFFITVDYAFGHDLEAKGISAVEDAGGTVVGTVRHSPQATDYSAFLLEAQAKGANTIGLATFGSYMINIIKQANEFGLDVKLVPFFLGVPDVTSVGAENMLKVSGTTAFYWNRDEQTAAWNAKFQERAGKAATFNNAQQYNAVTHYLKAVKQAGTTDADAVAKAMREIPVQDDTGLNAYVREDGRVMRDMYLVNIQVPAEGASEYDVMKVVATVDKEKANLPIAQSTCALAK